MTSKKFKGFLAATFLSSVTACGSGGFPAPATADTPPPDNHVATMPNYIEDVIDLARDLHVDPANPGDTEKLISAAINGALKELDPHSRYLTPKEFQAMRQSASGEFAGIGVTINQENGALAVTELSPGGPAEKAGLKAGDRITHVGGKSLADLTLEDSVKLIRGKPKTSVTLTIARGSRNLNVNVTRDIIHVPVVSEKMIGNDIGYIQLRTFHNDNVDQELADAVKRLNQNNNVQGYVLDLRNNPGGYLHMANAISDAFIDSRDPILTVKGRDENKTKTYRATPGDITGGKRIVVLINEGSASASEIVAGALQDTGRAVILGNQSYGKGSVQSIIPLKGGAALKVTTDRYYTAGGRSIQNHGITPDIAYIRNAQDDVPQITPEAEKANTIANLDKAGTDKTETRANCTAVTPTATVEKALQAPSGKADFALACAVENLRNKPALTVTTPVARKAASPRP